MLLLEDIIVPEIESLISLNDIWTVAGPIIITAVVILIVGLLLLIIKQNIKKGLLRDIFGIFAMVAIVLVTIVSFQITSYIWSL